jgi:hypothetical protein
MTTAAVFSPALTLALGAALGLSATGWADDGAPATQEGLRSNGKVSKPANRARRSLELTPEREAAALVFVKQHHAELSELLIYLKENRGRDYQRAIRDLFHASERLAMIRDRDQDRYQLELNHWKSRSRVQLTSAKLNMQPSPQLRQQLQRELEEQLDNRIALLRFEKDKVADRLQKLEEQIDRIANSKDKTVRAQMQLLVNSKRKSAKPRKKTPAPNQRAVPTKNSADKSSR